MRLWNSGYWLSCVLAALILLVSGFSHSLVQDVGSIGESHAIATAPRSPRTASFLWGWKAAGTGMA